MFPSYDDPSKPSTLLCLLATISLLIASFAVFCSKKPPKSKSQRRKEQSARKARHSPSGTPIALFAGNGPSSGAVEHRSRERIEEECQMEMSAPREKPKVEHTQDLTLNQGHSTEGTYPTTIDSWDDNSMTNITLGNAEQSALTCKSNSILPGITAPTQKDAVAPPKEATVKRKAADRLEKTPVESALQVDSTVPSNL